MSKHFITQPYVKMPCLIAHREYGVLLGCMLGLAFWSQLAPEGIREATLFAAEGEAREVVSSWLDCDEILPELSFVKVTDEQISAYGGATPQLCEALGLPSWNPDAEPLPDFVSPPTYH